MKTLRKILGTIKAGFKNAWVHKSSGFASVVSIAAVSIIMGMVIILTLTLNVFMEDVQTRVDEIEIYVGDQVSDEDLAKIREGLESRDEVDSMVFKDKEEALEVLKEAWGRDAYLLEGLEHDNPLERSFVVKVKDIGNSNAFVDYAEDLEGVSTVTYYQDTIDKLVKISNYTRLAAIGVSIILLVISVMMIYNTVKLTVQYRSEEIQIMKYIGASDLRITIPYIIEGLIFGLIGSFLAYVIIYYGYIYVYDKLNERLYQIISTYMVDPMVLRWNLLIIFAMLGIVIGSVGSVFASKKHLKV